MEGVLHTTLLTTTIFLSSLLPQATPSASFSPLPIIGQESFHVVKSGETLRDIAIDVYESEDGQSILIEDNPFITNPDYIEEGWNLKIRKNPYLKKGDPFVKIQAKKESTKDLAKVSTPTVVPEITPQVQSIAMYATESSNIIQDPTITPFPTQQPTSAPSTVQSVTYSSGPLNEAQIQYLGSCEAGMDPTKNTGNGYYGAFQFSYATWRSMNTGYERADLAPLEVQIDAVQRLLSRSSIYTQFPACARKMQSLGLI